MEKVSLVFVLLDLSDSNTLDNVVSILHNPLHFLHHQLHHQPSVLATIIQNVSTSIIHSGTTASDHDQYYL